MHIRFLLGMALGTNRHFVGFVADRVFCYVYLVAATAGNISIVMVIAFPRDALIIVMATHADTVLFLRGNGGILAEGDHRLFATLVMITERAVASLTL